MKRNTLAPLCHVRGGSEWKRGAVQVLDSQIHTELFWWSASSCSHSRDFRSQSWWCGHSANPAHKLWAPHAWYHGLRSWQRADIPGGRGESPVAPGLKLIMRLLRPLRRRGCSPQPWYPLSFFSVLFCFCLGGWKVDSKAIGLRRAPASEQHIKRTLRNLSSTWISRCL